eukprot:TRINITY_DN26967_c0_g1_i1.p1 TRINITY_DN26967_c0_g1~~TRINITY_DN26967_c0_g1_i1.p1  ORF type:complete len:145 (-),score=14.47 TRINITY_DN26967_c0_g1_i1:51-485(-)
MGLHVYHKTRITSYEANENKENRPTTPPLQGSRGGPCKEGLFAKLLRGKPAKEAGILPLRVLLYSAIEVSCCPTLSVGGMLPLKWFWSRMRFFSNLRLPSPAGMEPEMELKRMLKVSKYVRFWKASGMEPESSLRTGVEEPPES